MPLPAGPGPARDAYILGAAQSGAMQFSWAPITSSIPGHTATFQVFAKAAKVDGLYVGVGAKILQQIADAIGGCFLTPRLQDMMYQQSAVKILPWLDYSPTQMQSTAWFERATTGIDAKLAAAGYTGGVVQAMGKPWMLDNDLLTHPGKAENYGLYVPASSLSGGKYLGVAVEPTVSLGTSAYVLQGRGWAHTLGQDDYSELIVLASRLCVVDGVQRDIFDVMTSPTLAPLISHQGALQLTRQPGVPVVACRASGSGTMAAPPGGQTSCPMPETVASGNVASAPGTNGTSWGSALAIGGLVLGAGAALYWALEEHG